MSDLTTKRISPFDGVERVREYCIENKLFTHGSNHTYDKMFSLVRHGSPVSCIAAIIWACSENGIKTLYEIEFDIRGLLYEVVEE